MIYKEFQGLKLSVLGMGTVRLPITSENSADVNIPAVEKMVDAAIAQGVNYFDLGWDYHGCRAETIVSQSLLRYPRDSYYLATKFPGYYPDKLNKVEEVFEEQLHHCGVDYFDFYLLHNVCEANIDAYLDSKYGIIDYLLKQKEAGRIRHFGFSTHGEVESIRAFLDAAGQHMEFCQIQLNWLDWTFQRANEKMALLRERNIPVWVMEPLRGGKLLKLAEEDVKRLQALRPEETVYGWGLRFLHHDPFRFFQCGADHGEYQDLFRGKASHAGGMGRIAVHCRDAEAAKRRALHGLPLLRVSLPPAAEYSKAFGTV